MILWLVVNREFRLVFCAGNFFVYYQWGLAFRLACATRQKIRHVSLSVATYLRADHVKVSIFFKLKFHWLLPKCFTKSQRHHFEVANVLTVNSRLFFSCVRCLWKKIGDSSVSLKIIVSNLGKKSQSKVSSLYKKPNSKELAQTMRLANFEI